jgi:excisionase family DNA binding protein
MWASLTGWGAVPQGRNTRDFAPHLTHHPNGGKVAHMSNPAPDGGDLLTTAQVSNLTGWSVTSINRWAKDGDLPAAKLPGRTGAYLFARSTVEQYLRQREPAAS